MSEPRLVLIIDDNLESARVTKDAMVAIGLSEFKVVHSIKAAVDFLEYTQVVFIIIEQHVSGEKAADFIRHFRGNFNNSNYRIPVLMFMKNPSKADVTEARDSGVTEMMIKPFNLDTLSKIILSFLKQPRNFIISRKYVGPDRRRKKITPPDGSTKRKEDKKE